MNKTGFGITAVLIAVLSVFSGHVYANTALYYSSAPQSEVGWGESIYVTPADGFEFVSRECSFQVMTFWINNIDSNPGSLTDRLWMIEIAAPFNEILQPGHYGNINTLLSREESQPAFEILSDKGGNYVVGGFFDVYEAVYDVDGVVMSFAADFTQYDNGIESEWTIGSIRYNSDYPIPEPSTFALLLAGLPFLGFIWYNTQNRRTS
jgi:hypothetical protein